jgi:transposase
MEVYLRVRRAHFHDGQSGRSIARDFGISRDSVAKMLAYSEPPIAWQGMPLHAREGGYRRTASIKRPKLDAFTDQIDIWRTEDKGRPRKQRHTAKRIFDRLRSECDFTGGYTIVKDYVRSQKRGGKEMFVPLSHPAGHVLPGRRMQSILPRGRRRILARLWL